MHLAVRRCLWSAVLLIGGGSSVQAQLISLGKPVTGTSFYNSGSETFTYLNITDGLFNDTAGDGSTSAPYSPAAPHNWGFWLTPDGLPGSATIDLQSSFLVNEIDVQNTHNRGFNDRGTKNYHIDYSTDNVSFTSLITDVFGTWPAIPTVAYTTFTPFNARYIRFNIDTVNGSSGGLNEMSVFGTPSAAGSSTPEPGSLALLTGVIVPGMALLTRRRSRK